MSSMLLLLSLQKWFEICPEQRFWDRSLQNPQGWSFWRIIHGAQRMQRFRVAFEERHKMRPDYMDYIIDGVDEVNELETQ